MAGNLDPSIGGGASLCRTLLAEISRTPICDNEDSLVIFAEGKKFPDSVCQLGEVVVCRSKDLVARVSRHGCQVAWYISGGGFPPPIPMPYLATVWDLQHRTHPYLPEMQRKGEWLFREESTRPFLQQAARVVVGTRVGAAEITRFYGVPEDGIVVLPYPVPDLSSKSPPSFSNYQTSILRKIAPPFYLYPAQFWAHKNHAVVLRALARLRDQGVRCQVVFPGGDGGNLAFVIKLAEELKVSNQVVFPGFVPAEDLEKLYRECQALLFPSLSGPDNLPPLEALRAGASVLQSDSPGAREQLGQAAVYIHPLDEKAWAQGMLAELDPGNSVRIRARKNHGLQIVGERTSARYIEEIRNHLHDLKRLAGCWMSSPKA